jgi:hypothetical protein
MEFKILLDKFSDYKSNSCKDNNIRYYDNQIRLSKLSYYKSCVDKELSWIGYKYLHIYIRIYIYPDIYRGVCRYFKIHTNKSVLEYFKSNKYDHIIKSLKLDDIGIYAIIEFEYKYLEEEHKTIKEYFKHNVWQELIQYCYNPCRVEKLGLLDLDD